MHRVLTFDWKQMHPESVETIMEAVTDLGLYAHSPESYSDGVILVLSDKPMTEDEAQALWDSNYDED